MSKIEKEIIDNASLSAAGFYEPVAKKYPELRKFKNIKQWDFFATVAIVGSCLMNLQMEEDEVLLRNLQHNFQKEFQDFHPQGWDAIEDLFNFIDTSKKPSKPKTLNEHTAPKYLNQLIDTIALSVGLWVVLNLQGSHPKKSQFELSSTLANLFYKKVGVELAVKYAQNAN